MNYKKAQGLSMNTMAIAALVLILVVVVIMIFNDGARILPDFIGSQKECSARGGKCVSDVQDCHGMDGNYFSELNCKGDPNGEYCCIKD